MIRRDGDLPPGMGTAIARLVMRVEITPPNRLPNPISLLGFRVGYNRAESLRRTLDSLVAMHVPDDLAAVIRRLRS